MSVSLVKPESARPPYERLDHSPDTLDAAWYHDRDLFALQRKAIFERHWMLFTYVERLAQPGDYVAGTVAGYPIFVLRGRDGSLSAFHNVCRHRAAPLLDEGAGRCDVLRCRYHGWLYGHDGALKKAVDFGAAPDFDPADYGLFPVQVDVWGGLVFARIEPAGPSLLEWLGPIPKMAEGYDLAPMKFFKEKSQDLAIDWKTYGDNYLEGYHLELMHPGLCAAMDAKTYTIDPYARDGLFHLYAPKRDGGLTEGLYFYRFPCLMLNLYEWGTSIATMEPLGPGRVRHINWYFFADVSPEKAEENHRSADWSAEIVAEDIAVITGVQRNLEAGVYRSGRLSPKHEHGVKAFQDMVLEAVAEHRKTTRRSA